MGLEENLENLEALAVQNLSQSLSLSLAGGVAGGIALYKITEKMLNSTRKRGEEGTKPKKLYGIPHSAIMVTMAACGIYVGTQIAQGIPEMYNAVQNLVK